MRWRWIHPRLSDPRAIPALRMQYLSQSRRVWRECEFGGSCEESWCEAGEGVDQVRFYSAGGLGLLSSMEMPTNTAKGNTQLSRIAAPPTNRCVRRSATSVPTAARCCGYGNITTPNSSIPLRRPLIPVCLFLRRWFVLWLVRSRRGCDGPRGARVRMRFMAAIAWKDGIRRTICSMLERLRLLTFSILE